MAHQGTEQQSDAERSSAAGEETGQETAEGRHAAPEGDSGTPDGQQEAAPSEQPTEKQPPEQPSEQPTEKQQAAPSERPTEKQQAAPQRGRADTSWAEPEQQPHRRSVDVGEIAWRAGNVLATVVRTLALIFSLVLIVNVVLVLVGVNPANGVAQFVAGVADVVILGFRDLFVPADPVVALIVNSLVAAVFWAFVGEFVSRVIRFLAARVK